MKQRTATKLILPWDKYGDLLLRLAKLIPDGKYERVVGVMRGGIIPAVFLSHHLGIPCITLPSEVPVNKYIIQSGSLIVDDLVDTGDTLLGCDSDIAVLYKKPWSKVDPTYYVLQTERWVVFPYEDRLNDT